jgi:NADH-quinone oxidoreductase subunit N
MWTPDAYHGAPTPVTAFMSVGPKAAGFAGMLRVLVNGWTPAANQWVPLVIVLAVITMTFGNIVAVAQNNVKRMLAYSSIAHTGYMLVGLASYQVGANKADANGQAIGALLSTPSPTPSRISAPSRS